MYEWIHNGRRYRFDHPERPDLNVFIRTLRAVLFDRGYHPHPDDVVKRMTQGFRYVLTAVVDDCECSHHTKEEWI